MGAGLSLRSRRRPGRQKPVTWLESNLKGRNRRKRPLGRWKDRVKEYMSERGVKENGLEWARREGMGLCIGEVLVILRTGC